MADNATCADVGQSYLKYLKASPEFESISVTKGPTACTVKGRVALQYEVEAVKVSDRIKSRFLLTVVDGRRGFFLLAGMFLPSEAARYRRDLEDVTNSFVEQP